MKTVKCMGERAELKCHTKRRHTAMLLGMAVASVLSAEHFLYAGNMPTGGRFAADSGNVITPDGRTRTSVQTQGAVTTISTATLAGGDAFNSFSNFQVASGNTVNLIVPQAANYLVNLVHNSPVVINGLVNSYKNGHIGGNIIFADPSGVIVGASGVLNVGSVAFTTPTVQFMNQLLDEAGKVDVTAASQLIAGTEPLSANGLIEIEGRINALKSINLNAAEVIAAKSSVLTAGDSAKLKDALFHATVNTDGLQEGAALAQSNGMIAIVGTQQVQVAGSIYAGGDKGGQIAITAPKTQVATSAKIDASGVNGGGTIALGGDAHGQGLLADAQTLMVVAGAQILANAITDGSGGTITLWSNQGTNFAGNVSARGGALVGDGGWVEISSPSDLVVTGHVNTAAPHGATGTVLFDPTDLFIVNGTVGSGTEDSSVSNDGSGDNTLAFGAADGSPASTISVGELQGLGDTNITLQATDQITIGDSSGGAADINLSTDTNPLKTGKLILEAGESGGLGNIVFNSGSTIETGGGAVVLDAGAGFTGASATDILDVNGNVITAGGTATLGSITTSGGEVTVKAAESISLPSGSTIDTTSSSAAGAIDFEGGQTLNSGIDVNLTQSGSITIDGTLTGGNITLDEFSMADAAWDTSTTGIASFTASSAIGSLLGLAGQGVLANVNSGVSIDGSAQITGANVTIESQTLETASTPEIDLSLGGSPFAGSFLYGEVDGTATATVAKGATIKINSGGSLTVSATNKDTLDLSAYTVTTSSDTYIAATVAVGEANITSAASIASGANINLANNADVSVTAHNLNSFSVSATAMANSKGVVGISAAISDIHTSANAAEDASLGTASQQVGNVTVVGDNITTKEATTASGSAGSSFVIAKVLSAGSSVTNALGTKLSSMFGLVGGQGGSSSDSEGSSSTTPFRVGAAMGLALISQGSYAQVVNDDGASADTPVIDSSGNVLVHAATNTTGISNEGESAVNSSTSETGTDPNNPSNDVGVSVGVAVGIYKQTTQAEIGDNVQVTAANVGVSAVSNIPAKITWPQWDGFSDILGLLSDKTTGSFNVGLTSYANAVGNGTGVSIAGAINFFDVSNNTQAWIGTGAQVTSTATGETSSVTGSGSTDNPAWSVALGWDENALDYLSGGTLSNTTLDFNDPVTVNAYNFTQTIDVGGNFAITLNGSGAGSSGTGLGGAFNGILYENTTDAAIGSGAVVTVANSGPGLSVTAQGVDQVLAISPTSGRGSSVAGNGIFGFVDIENSTIASISNAADITAEQVVVDGQENLAIWNAAGAASAGSTAGVGIGLAISYFGTDTEAFIGDNSALTLGGTALGGTSGGGYVHATQLAVDALTDGEAGSLAVAGAEVSSSDPNAEPGKLDNLKSWTSMHLSRLSDKVSSDKMATLMLWGSSILAPAEKATTDAQSEQPDPSTSVGIAGSATFNVSELTTRAYVSGATLAGYSGGAIDPTVQALDYTGLISASGGASLVMAKNSSSESSAGIAGAVAFALNDNTTAAYIDDSTLTNVGAVNVNALAGGFEVTVGLGLSVNTSSSETSVAIDASLSIPVDTNTVSTYIQNSTLTGYDNTSSTLNVTAYDQTLIGVGGGGFYATKGEGAGIGVAITVGVIDNTVSAYLDGVTATEFDTVDVQALDAAQIYGGALEIGFNKQATSVDGSFVFNVITDSASASIDQYVPSSGSAVDSTIDTSGAVTVNAASSSDLAKSAFTASDYYYQLYPALGEGAIGMEQASSSPTYASLLSQAGGGDPTNSDINIAANIGGETLPSSSQNEIIGVAGFGSLSGGGSAVGLGLVVNVIYNNYDAWIDHATVDSSGGAVNVTATDAGTIIGAALGLAVSTSDISGLGSVIGNYMGDTTDATVGDSSGSDDTTVTGTAVNVTAGNNATIWGGAGSIGYGDSGQFGASIAYNQTADSAAAAIDGASADAGAMGTLTIQGDNASAINSIAVAGGVGGSAAIDGTVAVNLTMDQTTAAAANSALTAGYLDVTAKDPDATIDEFSGSFAGAGDVSVGASIGIANIENTLAATLTGVISDAGYQTNVTATSGGYIGNLAIAGAVSGSVSVSFANTSNNIGNTITAAIIDSAQSQAQNTTTIAAMDTSSIVSLSSALSGSGDFAGGVATAINRIANNVSAYMQGTASGTQPLFLAKDMVIYASSAAPATLPTGLNAQIESLAAGVAVSGSVSLDGSIAVNILSNNVNAYINQGADVLAIDNVGVEAVNENSIQVIAGGLSIGATVAAVGLTTAVNYIGGSTNACISGSGTSVTALANDSSDTLTVADGDLTTTPDDESITSLTGISSFTAPDLAEGTQTITGLAVNAETLDTLTQASFNAAASFDPFGSAAIDAVIGVNVMNTSTAAYIDSADINQTSSSGSFNTGSSQQVNVTASSHDYGVIFALGLAGGATDAGVAGSVGVNAFNGKTYSYITQSQTAASDGVTIEAKATQDGGGLAAGIGAAVVGGAATAIANRFGADTEAYLLGGMTSTAELSVDANSRNGAGISGGSGAFGGAGLGITVLAATSGDTTKAYVGDSTAGAATTLDLGGNLSVTAESTTDLEGFAVAASFGSIAGTLMASVVVIDNTTTANVYDTTLDPTASGLTAQAVTVQATDTLTVSSYAGGLAIGDGGVGVGAGVNVIDLTSEVDAGIDDSTMNVSGAVDVTANSTHDLTALTLNAGIGSVAAIEGEASVILIDSAGSDSSGGYLGDVKTNDSTDSSSGSDNSSGTGAINSVFGSSVLQDVGNDGSGNPILNSTDTDNINSATEQNLSLWGGSNGTKATISGGTINAGTVAVTATDTTTTQNIVGAVSIATGGAGFGAAIAVTELNGAVSATIDNGASVTAPAISVGAYEKPGTGSGAYSVQTAAYAGGGGGFVGFGAAVAVGIDNTTVSASAGGTLTGAGASDTSSTLAVTAGDSSTIQNQAVGVGVGVLGGAVGISAAIADKTASTSASIGGGSYESAFNGVSVTASDGGYIYSQGIAGAVGIVSGNGAAATSTDNATVTASAGYLTGSTATTIATGSAGLTLQATDTPDAYSSAIGVSLALVGSVGASVALTNITPTVQAEMGNYVTQSGGGPLAVLASLDTPYTGNSAGSYALAGAGGALLAANGAVATSQATVDLLASTGSYDSFGASAVQVNALSNTSENASATGVGVGFVAAGGVYTLASAGGTVTATLGSMDQTSLDNASDLKLAATSKDTLNSSATSGAGGGLAINAAEADTSNSMATATNIGDGASVYGDNMAISAQHTTDYFAAANALNASVVGGSGSVADNSITPTTTASLGDGVHLYAQNLNSTDQSHNALAIAADNWTSETSNGGYSAQGAGGGVINGNAVKSTTTINEAATINLGTGDYLYAGTDPFQAPGAIALDAYNLLAAADTTTLSTGGAIEGAGADSSADAIETDDVNIGTESYLMSFGTLGIGTYSINAVDNSGLVHTWGVAGVGVADADSSITANQNVSIADGVDMLAYGNLNIFAGQSDDGSFVSQLAPDATGESYVKGLIAIPSASATATANRNSTVSIGATSSDGGYIYGAQNVSIGAYGGQATAAADGTGHGYEIGLIPVTSHDNTVNTPDATEDVTLYGSIVAGNFNQQIIDIDSSGLTLVSGAPIIYSENSSFNPLTYVQSANLDSTVATMLENTVSSTDVTAYTLGQLFASGGNVTIHAGSLAGNATVTANSSPSITVTDSGPSYLLLGGIYIPDTPGGQILFSGSAGSAGAGSLSLNAAGAGTIPAIAISSTYASFVGSVSEGPAIFLTGDIYNILGSVQITNAEGSLGLFGVSIYAEQQLYDIPNGVVTIDDPGQFYSTGSNPISNWESQIWLPGDADTAVAVAATASYSGGSYSSLGELLGSGAFTGHLMHINARSGSTDAYIIYGAGMSEFGGTGQTYAMAQSPLSGAYLQNPDGYDGNTTYRPYYYYPVVPIQTLNYSKAYSTGFDASISTTDASSFVGAQIGINAAIIDLNSPISSGQATDWSVNLGSGVQTQINSIQSEYNFLRSFLGSSLNKNVTLTGLTHVNTGDQTIAATYNPASQQITIANVNASGGGFVYLHGAIINDNPNTLSATDTNGAGIKINDGYGHVSVQNTTTAPVVVQDINTGSSSIGEVKIVDTEVDAANSKNGTNNPDTWYYLYQQGVGLDVYNNSASGNGPDNSTLVESYGATTTDINYDPTSNAVYSWTETASVSRSITWPSPWPSSTTDGNAAPDITASDWTFNTSSGTNIDRLYWSIGSGTLNIGGSSAPDFQESISGSLSGFQSASVNYTDSDNGFYPGTGVSSIDYTDGYLIHYHYPTAATIVATMTVRVDNPVGIEFSGNSSASIDINSAPGITLAGQIHNAGGAATLEADSGSITQLTAANITTAGLTLTAGTGLGASPADPLQVTLTGGTLAATTTTGGVNINFNSSLSELSGVTAGGTGNYGNVYINAQGSITEASGTQITGDNITLYSAAGAVGTAANPVTISANGTLLANGASQGGVVNISALTGVDLDVTGNLVIGQIVAAAGDVTLNVGGQILDAAAQTPAQSLTPAQQAAILQSLHLTTADGAGLTGTRDGADTLHNMVDADYVQYWRLLANGSVSGGTFTLNSGSVTLYTNLAKAAGYTDASGNGDAAAYSQTLYNQAVAGFVYATLLDNGSLVNGQYQLNSDASLQSTYATLATANGYGSAQDFATAEYSQAQQALTAPKSNNPALDGDTSWQTIPGTTAPANPETFQYSITTTQSTGLTANVAWTDAELNDTINKAALGSGGTLVGSGTPNIQSQNVSITYSTAVGTLAAPVTINESDLLAGTLTTAQQLALALANAPGDVTITGDQSAGTAVINIIQTAPIFLNVTGTFSGTAAAGPLYVQAADSLTLTDVSASGDAYIAASQSILSGGGSGSTDITAGGTLVLDAGGSIGSSAASVNVAATGALSASAGDSIYLASNGTTLTVGAISAVNTIGLTTTNAGIQPESGYSGVNLSAPVIGINAGGDVGSASAIIHVDQGPSSSSVTPELDVTATGAVYIDCPSDTDALAIDAISADGELVLTSNADLTATGDISSSGGDVSLTASGNMTLTSVTASTGNLSAESGGYLTLDNGAVTKGTAALTSTKYMDISTGLSSGGVMMLTSGGYLDFGALSSGSNVQLTAPGDISGNSLSTTNNSNSGITSTGGSITVTSLNIAGALMGNAHITLALTTGQVGATANLTSGGYMTIATSLTAAGGMMLKSGDYLDFGALTSGGYATFTASGDVKAAGGSLTTTNGKNAYIDSTGGYIALGTATIAGGLTIKAGGGNLSLTTGSARADIVLTTTKGDINAGTVTSSIGALTGTSSGAISITTGTAAGEVSLTATDGNITIGQLVSSVAGNKAFDLNASGAIVDSANDGAGPDQTNLSDPTAGTQTMSLQSGDGIGTAGAYLIIDLPQLSATATTGDIDIHSLEGLNATSIIASAGNVNLPVDGTLTFATITAGKDAVLTASSGITGTTITAGDNASLITTGGDITVTTATATNGTLPLNSAGAITLVTGTAKGEVSLTANGGDITIGQLISSAGSGTAFDLNASGAIVDSANDGSGTDQTNLSDTTVGASAQLQAGTGIGSANYYLVTDVPELSATATSGDIDIHNLEGLDATAVTAAVGNINLHVDGTLTFDTFTACQDAALTASNGITGTTITAGENIALTTTGGDITVTTATAINGMLTLTSAGAINLTSGSAEGEVSLTTNGGDITIGQLSSSVADGTAFDLNASGAIVDSANDGSGTDQTNLSDNTAGATAQLQAGIGIGSANYYLVTDVPELSATANSGDIDIHNLEGLNATAITAPEGSINLPVDGTLTFGAITAGLDAALTASSGITGTTITAGDIASLITTGGDITVTTATATNGKLTLTSAGVIYITTGTAKGEVSLTASGGDVTIGQISSSLTNGLAIYIDASGAIVDSANDGSGSDQTNLSDTTAGATAQLQAGIGIGSSGVSQGAQNQPGRGAPKPATLRGKGLAGTLGSFIFMKEPKYDGQSTQNGGHTDTIGIACEGLAGPADRAGTGLGSRDGPAAHPIGP